MGTFPLCGNSVEHSEMAHIFALAGRGGVSLKPNKMVNFKPPP